MKTFTIIIRHTENPSDGGSSTVAVTVRASDPKVAADEACLWLISRNMGIAEPLFAIGGSVEVEACDCAVFDADDYDDTITSVGYIGHKTISIQ